MTVTTIEYASRDGDHVAYATRGSGPPDIVLVSNFLTDVESMWDAPFMGRYLEHLARYGRMIWFDQPGTGHSDPIFGEMPSIETFADTVEVVMDAAGVERAALLAWDLATAPAVMFAATRPERTSALVTVGGSARWLADDGYPGIPEGELDALVEQLIGAWGKPAYGRFLAPSMADDPASCEAVGRWMRHALSPGMARRFYGLALRADVRALLGSVTCPVLAVTSRSAAAAASIAQVEYLVEHLPDARLEVFETADHLPYQRDHFEWFQAVIQEFLTGQRPAADVDDRVLATILFTDVVASTETAARLGDRTWRHRLDEVEAAATGAVAAHKGRLVKTTGDGILATFDGPARAVRCAAAIRDASARQGLAIRAGVHTGEVELRGEDIGGIAVHLAARVMALAGAGDVLVSSTVKDLVVGSGLAFADRGEHELKGVPGAWRLYAAVDGA